MIGPKVMAATVNTADASNAGLWMDGGPVCIDLSPGIRNSGIEPLGQNFVAPRKYIVTRAAFQLLKDVLPNPVGRDHCWKMASYKARLPNPLSPSLANSMPSSESKQT